MKVFLVKRLGKKDLGAWSDFIKCYFYNQQIAFIT